MEFLGYMVFESFRLHSQSNFAELSNKYKQVWPQSISFYGFQWSEEAVMEQFVLEIKKLNI